MHVKSDMWEANRNALDIKSGLELLDFGLGTVEWNGTNYTILTGHEVKPHCCFWCGAGLQGKRNKRYCYGHMKLYYRHFDWNYSSEWALERAGHMCENCGKEGEYPRNQWGRLENYNLQLHHIVPLAGASRQFTAYNLPWNLIVLCRDCHLKIHRIMSSSNKSTVVDNWQLARERGQAVMEWTELEIKEQ